MDQLDEPKSPEDAANGRLAIDPVWPKELPVTAANVFRLSRVQNDFLFMFGYLNVAELVDAINELREGRRSKEETVQMSPISAGGLSMGPDGFRALYERVVEFNEQLKQK